MKLYNKLVYTFSAFSSILTHREQSVLILIVREG